MSAAARLNDQGDSRAAATASDRHGLPDGGRSSTVRRRHASRRRRTSPLPSRRDVQGTTGHDKRTGLREARRESRSDESLERTATCSYDSTHAKVAELADAQDSGSCGLNTRGGSSPPFRILLAWETSRAMPTCGAAALLVLLLATGAARATGPAERRCERALSRVGPRLLARSTGLLAACARAVATGARAASTDCLADAAIAR